LYRPCGSFRVSRIVLAESATVLAVGPVHLKDLYAPFAQEAAQSHAEAAAAFDAGTVYCPEFL
jgi:hypothetical protein